jgi:GT2 family glycosyltransferase
MVAPHITACIVTYKSNLDDVYRAVESLSASTLPIEILVVDNHSGDDYYQALKERLSSFEDVLISDSGANKGFGAGHNFGFATVSDGSDIHLVINPDIIVHKGAIEAMVDYMEQRPEVGLLAPKIVDEHGNIQYLCKRFPSMLVLFGRRFMPKLLLETAFMKRAMDAYQMKDHDYNTIIEPPCISGCFMMFRSQLFEELLGFDERFFLYFEDFDISLRAHQISRAVYFPHATVTHKWRGGSRQSFKLVKIQIRSAVRFFNKWGWKWV